VSQPSLLQEFHYRWPRRSAGYRPGAHAGRALGSGAQPDAHGRLFDHPDPRRIDLRASLRDPRGEWLVRVARQRVAAQLYALVDVSPSMFFGARRPKLAVVQDFVRALGWSAYRNQDAAGLMAFDHAQRAELGCAARHGRGVPDDMGQALARAQPRRAAHGNAAEGLWQCAQRLAGREALVFIVSDFHGMCERRLSEALDSLQAAHVVPLLTWDSAETQPPAGDGLLLLQDAERASRAALWLRPKLRAAWRDGVAQRNHQLSRLLA